MLLSCIALPHLRLLWGPADAHVRPQTFPLWYKSLWRASIISSNNELSLDLTDVSVWMCQRASGLTEHRAAAVHHFQGLPVSTGGTWDKPVSVRDYIWRLTLDQRRGRGRGGDQPRRRLTPPPNGENEKQLRKMAEKGDEGLTDKCQVVSGGFFFFFLTTLYFVDERKGVVYSSFSKDI